MSFDNGIHSTLLSLYPRWILDFYILKSSLVMGVPDLYEVRAHVSLLWFVMRFAFNADKYIESTFAGRAAACLNLDG